MFLHWFVFCWSFHFSIIPSGISQQRAAAATSPFNPPRLRGRRGGWGRGYSLAATGNWWRRAEGGRRRQPIGEERARCRSDIDGGGERSLRHPGVTTRQPEEPESRRRSPGVSALLLLLFFLLIRCCIFLISLLLPHTLTPVHPSVQQLDHRSPDGRTSQPNQHRCVPPLPVLRGAFLSTPATRSQTRTTRNDPHLPPQS